MMYGITLGGGSEIEPFAALLIAVCVVLVLLPPRFDPAIRIKEWQVRTGRHPESKDADQ